jgi:hypothetical protein
MQYEIYAFSFYALTISTVLTSRHSSYGSNFEKLNHDDKVSMKSAPITGVTPQKKSCHGYLE